MKALSNIQTQHNYQFFKSLFDDNNTLNEKGKRVCFYHNIMSFYCEEPADKQLTVSAVEYFEKQLTVFFKKFVAYYLANPNDKSDLQIPSALSTIRHSFDENIRKDIALQETTPNNFDFNMFWKCLLNMLPSSLSSNNKQITLDLYYQLTTEGNLRSHLRRVDSFNDNPWVNCKSYTFKQKTIKEVRSIFANVCHIHEFIFQDFLSPYNIQPSNYVQIAITSLVFWLFDQVCEINYSDIQPIDSDLLTDNKKHYLLEELPAYQNMQTIQLQYEKQVVNNPEEIINDFENVKFVTPIAFDQPFLNNLVKVQCNTNQLDDDSILFINKVSMRAKMLEICPNLFF